MKGLLSDILKSLKSWGFKKVFVSNAHGDGLHIETIGKTIEEVNQSPDFSIYLLWDLDITIESNIDFPPMRENRYHPDYHAGANETAMMATFFPEKVRFDVAKSLLPQDSFHPLAYCGDPASHEIEFNVSEFTKADTKTDAIKIEALLRRDGR